MLRGYGDHAQEEEDEGLGDGAQHLDHVADGRAGTLGDVFLHVVLHSEGAGHDAAGERTQQDKVRTSERRPNGSGTLIGAARLHSRHDG